MSSSLPLPEHSPAPVMQLNAYAQPALTLLKQHFESIVQHACSLHESLLPQTALSYYSAQHLHQLRLAHDIIRHASSAVHSKPVPMQLEAFILEWESTAHGSVKPASAYPLPSESRNIWLDTSLLMPLLDGYLHASSASPAHPVYYHIDPRPSLMLGAPKCSNQWVPIKEFTADAELLARFTLQPFALVLAYGLLISGNQPISCAAMDDDETLPLQLKLDFTPL